MYYENILLSEVPPACENNRFHYFFMYALFILQIICYTFGRNNLFVYNHVYCVVLFWGERQDIPF